MKATVSLDYQINRFGFWSVIVGLISGIGVTMLLPLDVPDGFSALHTDRIAWLNDNRGAFISGWLNQIVSMFTLSAVLACGAWVIVRKNPLRALLAAFFVAMATMAFIIPKFIAIWTIPLLADTVTSGAVGAELADKLLLLLNVSFPFSLFTSFDYLGFWLYSVFALLAAGPQWGDTLSAKFAAGTLGAFGLIYQVLMVMLLVGAIAPADIETYFLSAAILLLPYMIAMAFVFKNGMNAQQD